MKTSVRNSAYTKLYNRQLILNIIQKEPLSRAELAQKIGLTRVAASIIIDAMIMEGLITEKGTADTGLNELGRKPVLLDINPEAYYALGLNILRDNKAIKRVFKKTVISFPQQSYTQFPLHKIN